MKTYSVKQIAEMLGTNPETVRRWIRDKKLSAEKMSSRKAGNTVTEADLERFIKATPKYSTKLTVGVGLATISPVVGIGALAGGIVASALHGLREGKNGVDICVRPEDLKSYLRTSIKKLNGIIENKQELIRQTEAEIEEISDQIKLYASLLETKAEIDEISNQIQQYTSLLKTKAAIDEITDQIKQNSSLLEKEYLEYTLARTVMNKEG